MSICGVVELCAPSGAEFFEASHWPSGHMISFRPPIGPPRLTAKKKEKKKKYRPPPHKKLAEPQKKNLPQQKLN